MIKLQLHPDARMLRQFGWASLFAFPLIAVVLRLRWQLPLVWMFVLAAIGLLVFAAERAGVHAVPRFVFRVLVLGTFPIGFVLFPLLVGLIYYGLFTPIGLLFRLAGRDPMKRRFEPDAASYWHVRTGPRPADSYFKLY